MELHLRNFLYGRRPGRALGGGETRDHYFATHNALLRNSFAEATRLLDSAGPRAKDMAWHLSLGTFGEPMDAAPRPDQPTFPIRAHASRALANAYADEHPLWNLFIACDAAIARAFAQRPPSEVDRHVVKFGLRFEEAWAPRVAGAMSLATIELYYGNVPGAARATLSAQNSYLALCRLATAEHHLLSDFRDTCCRVLASFDPPIAPGKDPVRKLSMIARRLRRKTKVRASRTIRALDAIITVGRSAADQAIERRVVRELARMLHARVLLHYSGGQYHHRESQDRHTLSTWTIRTLVRERRFVARTIKPRPEFWRPEQRRPRGLLSFPIGDGTACLARRKPFGRKDAQAVRAVLRFLRARLEHETRTLTLPQRAPTHEHKEVAPGIVGESRAWRQMLDKVWRLAPSNTPVFVRGETGSGKELTARSLHLASRRSQGPFVVVNCAAINEGTMLSELFGHVRGAFSGAHRSRKGLFEQADRGTLFFDELAEMPYSMQVALLRVLEERSVRPVGSTRARPVDVRIVSATNQDLQHAVTHGEFREDLFHRLCGLSVSVPPLRERMSDLPAFVDHFLRQHDGKNRLHVDCLPLLQAYTWPGNLRELDNVLRAAALLSDGDEIEPDLMKRILQERKRPTAKPVRRVALAPRSESILERMGSRWWTCREIAQAIDVSVRTANRDLAELCDQGLVEARGRNAGNDATGKQIELRHRACAERQIACWPLTPCGSQCATSPSSRWRELA